MTEKETTDPMIGKKFNRLTVISYAGSDANRARKYRCLCDCGNESVVYKQSLKTGHSKSCGCLRKEVASVSSRTHGMRKTSIYNVWSLIVQRCDNSNDPSYVNYGGRGITLCDRWHLFENFYADMGQAPFLGASVDRMDNSKGYSPENCRWATRKEQANNRRSNRIIEFDFREQTLTQWSLEIGISVATLWARLFVYQWTINRAFTEPVHRTAR